MVLEKMALVGDALSHVALPGLALGILYNFNPFFGAFAFLFASAVAIWELRRITKLSFETLVGAVFTLSLAIARAHRFDRRGNIRGRCGCKMVHEVSRLTRANLDPSGTVSRT